MTIAKVMVGLLINFSMEGKMKKFLVFVLVFFSLSMIFAECPRLLGSSTQRAISTGGENIVRVSIICGNSSGRATVEVYDYVSGQMVDAVPLSCSARKTAERVLRNLPNPGTYRFELKCE
jgi:hypothetical protein